MDLRNSGTHSDEEVLTVSRFSLLRYSYSRWRSVAHYHVSGAGPFRLAQDVFWASQGLFRCFGARTITRDVVGARLVFLIKFEMTKIFKTLKGTFWKKVA